MSKYHPADYSGDGTGSVVVQVTSGDTATSLAPELVKLGVVASSRAFVLAAEHSSNSSGLLPGFYGMHKQMKASLAYAILINPKNMVQIKVTIPEGWRLSQIVSFLGAKSGIPLSAYAEGAQGPGAAAPARLRQRQARGIPVPRDLRGAAARDRTRRADRHGAALQRRRRPPSTCPPPPGRCT